jgi:hypothetical protein
MQRNSQNVLRWCDDHFGSLDSAGDKLLHDFVGSSIDSSHSSIGPRACNRVLPHVASTTVQLKAFVSN